MENISGYAARNCCFRLCSSRPPLYFGGSSDVAQDLAAEQVDLYLTWGEPPEQVRKKSLRCVKSRPPRSYGPFRYSSACDCAGNQ
jgi:hypothetical protein